MTNKVRYLITDADERTWKFDRPVIFLGEWCRTYERKHVWQGMDAIVAAPYGLDQDSKDSDHIDVQELESKLFPVLCDTLNRHHGIQHGERFWRIILGHWLARYVSIMLNRVKTLKQCLQVHQVSGITTYGDDHYTLATQDSYSFILASNDERWNVALTARILSLLECTNFPVEVITGDSTSAGFCWDGNIASTPKWGRSMAGKLASYLVRDSDALIIHSYLPKKEEIKLQLVLGQCPQLWTSPKLKVLDKYNQVLRKRLAKQVVIKSGNAIENILFSMAFELLPICYLESFDSLNKLVKEQPWPKEPKFIFTSNDFDTNEVFKIYTAQKAEEGIKYFVGQHGNNYGVSLNHHNPSNEEITADKFLTWGWVDGLPQHTPAFIFKTANRKRGCYNSQGGLLLIELPLKHRISTSDGTAEFNTYFEDQQKFINKLTSAPRRQLVVRLHAGYRHMKWGEEKRWQAFDPLLKIDTGDTNVRELVGKSRLVVHSYDSTGILETLSQNIPTLAFWQNGFDHLRDSAKPQYQLLVDAGIVHLTPGSVAKKVNEVWDDVDGWWGQSIIQDARKQFCSRHARQSENPIRELKQILMK
jgi:putative transferase (TIGR04331 family)